MAEPSQRQCVEQLGNTGIINSTMWSHLVGSFYEIYIMMHGSMNIKDKRLYSFFIMSTMALGPTQPPIQWLLVATAAPIS